MHAYPNENIRHTQVQDVVTAADGARSVLTRTPGAKRCALQQLERYIPAAHLPENSALNQGRAGWRRQGSTRVRMLQS